MVLWGRKSLNESTRVGISRTSNNFQNLGRDGPVEIVCFILWLWKLSWNQGSDLPRHNLVSDSILTVLMFHHFAALVCVSYFIAEPADAFLQFPLSLWFSHLYQCMTWDRTTSRDEHCDGLNCVLQKDAEVLNPSTCFLQHLVYTCILLRLLTVSLSAIKLHNKQPPNSKVYKHKYFFLSHVAF